MEEAGIEGGTGGNKIKWQALISTRRALVPLQDFVAVTPCLVEVTKAGCRMEERRMKDATRY